MCPLDPASQRRVLAWASNAAVIIEQASLLLNGVTRGDVSADDPRLDAFASLAVASTNQRPELLRDVVIEARRLQRLLVDELLRINGDGDGHSSSGFDGRRQRQTARE